MWQKNNIRFFFYVGFLLVVSGLSSADISDSGSRADNSSLSAKIVGLCQPCADLLAEGNGQGDKKHSGVQLLEYGEDSLLARAWLTDNSVQSIDVQYFIWSTDNVGTIAGGALLNAADRGVKVRVIVDDFLIDAEDKTLLMLDAHPNVDIKIYNPAYNVGNSFLSRLSNIVFDFRGTNQRMHDKVAVFDGVVGITGGRNMADEYFDFDPHYNFRDRDILVVGAAVRDMSDNFDEFWRDELSVSVTDIFPDIALTQQEVDTRYDFLRRYVADENNYNASVKRAVDSYSESLAEILQGMHVQNVNFVSDRPGKNNQRFSLGGGSETADRLLRDIQSAKQSILIQSPYLIVSDALVEVMRDKVSQGVSVKISTNSLASTDNLYAFSGYQKQRQELLAAGIQVYEYRPAPANQSELMKRVNRLQGATPEFAIHAKSMVIDEQVSYVGTFNMDPRSANLNTEVGVIVDNQLFAEQLTRAILADMAEGNSWYVTSEFNPDGQVPLVKRVRSRLYGLLPLELVL